ncbi:methyl-accepting chemotaxis protein [Bosea sp. (in: a-proteobacteria)]|uniref:methyl-accepting chemotaxis protein n=1 Tax=Bosea sp. (in: a-proteobacteria) TaxID=1871050 RepID=UPI002B46ABF7|nr:methyl-accepting chemotaxis protein [Bosea sp. (in: a-proteobacteria)]WRH60052.1 MAG: methyl-accepting chemotaxis protein [Bosea sp. (in: a-proteobacteria)]
MANRNSKMPFRFPHLSIGAKILVLLGTVAAPFAMMTYLYVATANKDITFAELERSGVAYVEALSPVMRALGSADSGGAPRDILQAAETTASRFDPLFKSEDAVKAFIEAAGKPDRMLALEAGKAALQKIADGSNLTLDPDLDSFYLMDTIIFRLPELSTASIGLRRAIQPYLRNGQAPLEEFMELVAVASRLEKARDALNASLQSAMERNADGEVRRALSGQVQNLLELSHRLSSMVGTGTASLADGGKLLAPAQLIAAADAVLAASTAIAPPVQLELMRLLTKRIDGFTLDMRFKMGIVGVFLLLTLLLGIAIVRSIRRPLGDLIETICRFEAGDYSPLVPHAELRNEIGAIARAIDQGRVEAGRSALTVSAMNQSPTMLMITDPAEKITFISASLLRMLKQLEPTFQAATPAFRVEAMMGQHIDCYRANANLKRQLILDNGQVRKVRYDVGSEAIMVDMAYIHDEGGRIMGHTLIWRNVTAELQSEAEVAAVVDAARKGDFSARLSLDDKDGFVRDIAMGLNQVSAVVEQSTTEFAQAMQAIAAADLTRPVSGDYHGVFATLKTAINDTVDRLSSTVKTIQLTSADVGLAAREINMGADDLSKRTEDQASSLEETAATTEQLAASVKATAQASRQAASVANDAMQAAQTGGAIAGQAVDAMARIESASTKISDIIRVIDDIAFQTNLLALNAAVEAARAGDAGKGFAVVASEVRTLAQRSSEAAKDISALISSSNSEVGEGVKLVRQAGEQLSQILAASEKVAATIAEISAASGEQASGIDEMSQAVAHLDEMTQQNAALSEQSAASAGSLSGKIAQLNDLVAAFKTGPDTGRAAAAPAPAGEPARLRQLAEAAFAQTRAPAPRAAAPVPAPRPAPAPARKVANSRAGDAGWEEF